MDHSSFFKTSIYRIISSKIMRKAQILLFILLLGSEAKAQNYSVPSKYEFESSLKKPETIIRVSENHYFIDFGKAAFGTIEISTEQSQADTIVLHLGEKITGENKIDRNPGGTIRYQKVHLINMETEKPHHVELPAVKRNTCPPAIILPDSFGVIMPFRYCELENLKIPIDEIEIRQKVYNYKFDENASSFISSDTILNQIWDLCKHTIKATSFAGLYIDGDRERIPYEADAFINQLSHYCVDTEYSIARRTNEYFIEHPTWPTEWVLHTVLLFYYDYLYTGDLKSITNNYEVLKRKTLMDLEGKDGLISSKSDKLTEELMKYLGFSNPNKRIRDIVDWPGGERDGYDMKDVNTVVNSFYYINLKLMSEIAGYLGKEKDSVFFKEKSILVKDAINEKLFDQIKGVYIDGEGSEH